MEHDIVTLKNETCRCTSSIFIEGLRQLGKQESKVSKEMETIICLELTGNGKKLELRKQEREK